MTKLSELRGLLRPDQVAQEPSVEDVFRAWKLNRWPGRLPKSPDWGDVETAFRAGLFQGDAYAHFSAASGPQVSTNAMLTALQSAMPWLEMHGDDEARQLGAHVRATIRRALDERAAAGVPVAGILRRLPGESDDSFLARIAAGSTTSGVAVDGPTRRMFTGGSQRCKTCGKGYLDHYGKFCDPAGVQKDGGAADV
jgi:hypothetical protein